MSKTSGLPLFLLLVPYAQAGTLTSGSITTPLSQFIELRFTGIDDNGQAVSADIVSSEPSSLSFCTLEFPCLDLSGKTIVEVTGLQVGDMQALTATVNGVPYSGRAVEGRIAFDGQPLTNPFSLDWTVSIAMYDTEDFAVGAVLPPLFSFTANGTGLAHLGQGKGNANKFSTELIDPGMDPPTDPSADPPSDVPEPRSLILTLTVGLLAFMARRR